ncbi:MAG: immune inhibitor A, partial [Cryobacterium sp.]|nr:immune inhibitor A [Cryobacterium sp.]
MRARSAAALVVVGGLLTAGLTAASVAPAGAAHKNNKTTATVAPDKPGKHNNLSPMAKKQDALKQVGLKRRLKGDPSAQGKVTKVANGQYVELEREGTDRVFAIIAEFGNTRHSAYCDPGQSCAFPPDGSAQKYDGPLHNQIPAPDRAIDNSTLWQGDYNKAHYEDMYFNRMASYFQHQSSNRYSVVGDVNGWVKVPFNEARYGRDSCGGIVCSNTWFLIKDAMAFWVQGQLDSGKTLAQVEAYLTTFDVQDRYDFDGDGNFAEKDGYIDHFQIVHAGGDQAAGDPIYGSDAIWSHRWYANINPFGTGPAGGAQFGGTQIGQGGDSGGYTGIIPNNRTNVWVGDYTIQPENGGLGVFAHEYTHDLGLPDLYDTSGNTGGAENSTGFWSLMSSGANIGDGGPDGIGDAPTDLTAWELFQL